jgi:hypothetical protein
MTGGDRQFALAQAVAAAGPGVLADAQRAQVVTQVADVFYRWLTGPVAIKVTIAAVTVDRRTGVTTPTNYQGASMATLTDAQQVTLSVAETDSMGQPVTGDALVWASDSPSIVLTPAPDGYSALADAGVPGTANVTVTDSTSTPPLVGTAALTVIPGAAVSLTIIEGAPVDKPPPPAV